MPAFKVLSSKSIGSDIVWVEDVIDKEKKCWDKDKLGQAVSEIEMQAITSIPLTLFEREDRLVWHHTSTGVYSVKSGYRVAMQGLSQSRSSQPSSSFVPHKNLAVWFGCNVQWMGEQGPPHSVIKWTSQAVEDLQEKELIRYLSRVVVIAWYIWKSRNEFVFNSDPINPEKTVRRIIEALKESREARVPQMIHMDNPAGVDNSQWRAPNQGRFKFNCDVAVMKNGQEAACAAVVRNWNGKLIDGHVISATVSSSLQGELLAIRLACGMASSMGLTEVEIESDNQLAIKLSASELVPPWEVEAVVQDIRFMKQSGGISFKWVKREANGLAHVVASKSLRRLLPRNWVANPPSFVASILLNDCISPL
ncbi:hypothetical protein RHMOL_Rhmol08G0312200 [Rhododendron molle]|uniref:Uncharacterized protein n=1 Tax=Rhododendron molle TaxID=49168 RepID=A0ACC0MVH4_RHOML|nr:hypothetical protein RHMOL_Rhmol08G0312200 [Rhododendron molle]